ncbi:MAG: DUF4198 domain-containing protein [Deltaproteobacteria bacterium]|nr:DUF4198 domain-containing protein [Deltaproteobacteria bacterium]MBW2137788.1 DUF4198 domain-containing protein [Deltaproteobacteria bacterium]
MWAKGLAGLASVLFWLGMAFPAFGHFGMIIPSDSMVMQGENRTVEVILCFAHPFEGMGMDLERPRVLGVDINGKKRDILNMVKEAKMMGHRAWKLNYRVSRPGVYTFYMEPEPYWEPAENSYIIHYTKNIIGAFGWDSGWDVPLGLKTEIVPLTRPFGLYAGNVFQGIVMLEGRPVPYSEVEVEYYNRDGRAVAPNDYMITQVIKADKNGVFTFAAPQAGWWGFAALNPSRDGVLYKGEKKPVELGAVLWIEFQAWKEKK